MVLLALRVWSFRASSSTSWSGGNCSPSLARECRFPRRAHHVHRRGSSKYVPGSIWPMLAQSELGADRGVPRSRSAVSVLLSYCRHDVPGTGGGEVTLPFATAGSIAQYFWILFLVPVAAVALSPPVLNRLLRLVLRVPRRPVVQQNVSYQASPEPWRGRWRLVVQRAHGLRAHAAAGRSRAGLAAGVGRRLLALLVRRVPGCLRPGRRGCPRGGHGGGPGCADHASDALTVALLAGRSSVVGDAVAGAAASALVGRRRLRRLRTERSLTRPSPQTMVCLPPLADRRLGLRCAGTVPCC